MMGGRSIRVALAAACALACLSACAPKIGLPTPDTRLPIAFEAKAGASPAQQDTAVDRWWLLFNDAQLTALVEQSMSASPDARSALGRLREARANRTEALFGFYPQGNPSGSAAEQHTDYSISGVSAAAAAALGASGGSLSGSSFGTQTGYSQQFAAQWNVSWELDLFGRFPVARRAADADLDAAAFDYEATRISLAAQTATSLFQARGAAVQLSDAIENAGIAHRLANAANLRVKAGLAAGNESARLESDAEAADAEVARLTAVVESTRRQLLVFVGQGAAPAASVDIAAVINTAPAVPESAPGELLARRPDVRRAERQLAAASARVQLDKLALFPRFTLNPGGTLSRANYSTYDITSTLASIGAGVVVPVLDRKRLLAEIKAQTARGEQAVAGYEKAVQSAYSDAEQALALIVADQRRVRSLTDATARARYAFDAITIGYNAGLIDLTTLVQAQQSWRNVRATLRTAQTAALLDSVTAFKALGGGWDPNAPSPVKTASR